MSGSRKKKKKIVKYRRPINIGVVFFGFLAVYLIVCVYLFFTSTHISGYEVIAGNLATDYHYTGVALRTEQIYNAEKPGYVNYYAREGEKVAVTSTVYTVDESGKMSELLSDDMQDLNLSKEDYAQLRSEVSSYMGNATDLDFGGVYNFKNSVDSSILALLNQNLIDQLDSAMAESGSFFTRYNAATAGVVEYYIDGFEMQTVDHLSADWFNREAYEKKDLRTEELVGEGEPVYKLVTEEKWNLVFPLDMEIEQYLVDKMNANQVTAEDGTVTQRTTYIQIRFVRDKQEVWPSVTVEYRDGKAYGVLEFINSMVRYAGERFLEFEVLRDETNGLKIPKSAVTEKEFFCIDADYVTKSGSDTGFMKQMALEDGTRAAVFVKCTIYYQDEEYAYVDPEEEDFGTSIKKLETGDLLIKSDSSDYFQVGQTGKLKGVYNINKGYTVFRQIDVLYENEEYCIVKEGTAFGLSVYDHIVLNADTVKEDEVIY